MASCLPNLLLLLSFFSLLLIFPSSLLAATTSTTADLTNHGGPLLTGNLNLTFIWYGNFGRATKNVMRAFVKSLTSNGDFSLQPQVSQWWSIVEGFQEASGKGKGPITVQVVKQFTDAKCSAGNTVTPDFVKDLVNKYDPADPNTVPVIFTARDVKVQGLCTGNCSIHGIFENKPYLIVGNPEKECPGQCGWPFSRADIGPIGVQTNPPNGNIGTDAMVVAFAQGLVNVVTNPFNNAFFQSNNTHTIEAGTACPHIFGTGALPGYTGRIRVDPSTGGGFNSHGTNGNKFLLPGIWDPKTNSCWTLM